MTDTFSLAATTHSTANPLSVTVHPLPSPLPNGNVAQSVQEDDDEPYTIKCICAFEDDDGHTVFCERCETWQHILCYYGGDEVPEVHNCTDCEPRPLDSNLATELQKRCREEQSDGGDRKTKRSGSKSQRKKTKDSHTTGDQTNGWSHERSGSNSRDNNHHPPIKKSKSSHRASNSIGSLTGLLPSQSGPDNRKRATSVSAMSPTKASLIPSIPLYSQEFLHLYDNDHANVDIPSNLFDNLKLATDLSSWVQDPVNLALVANGRSSNDVFTYLDRPLDPAQWPLLSKQTVTDTTVEYNGRHATWQFLTVENDVRKDEIIGEVKGKVGHFRDYCLDPNSRWQELRHPEPFVFFHPQLPIYIDSRKEGSMLRYVRRSCRPNVTMKTVITNDIEYHFCLVASQDITAKSEITMCWYLDPQTFPSNGFVKQEGSNDGISDAAAISISNVLANFGGCACDSSSACHLAKIDCRRPPKHAEPTQKQVNGRRKKSKAKNAISPVNTGIATNSRAGSEAVKAQGGEEDRVESRSRSTSNHPRSPDLTPISHSPTDPLALIPGELSAREKRKIAAAEKKFEQLEHDQQHPPKKKKRTSGASAQVTKTGAATSHTQPKTSRLDPTNAHRSSSSPRKRSPTSVTSGRGSQSSQKKNSRSSTPNVTSPLRPIYVDSEMQTEPDESDPYFVPPKPTRRQSFVPLTTRLLKRCHQDRLKLQEMNNRINQSPGQIRTFPLIPSFNHGISSAHHHKDDVDMKDTDADITMTPPKNPHTSTIPASPGASALSLSISTQAAPAPLHSLPSTVAHSFRMPRKPPDRPYSDLCIQPPTSQLASPAAPSVNTPISTTPVSTSSIAQAPFNIKPTTLQPATQSPGSSTTAPSPVKKKLSLGDYMSRRGTLATPTTDKPQPPLFPSSSTQQPQLNQIQPQAEPRSPNTNETHSADAMKHDISTGTSARAVTTDAVMQYGPILESPSGEVHGGSGGNGTGDDPSKDPRLQPR
ncbi:hypothetical protein GX48_02588 [Paracoccidioides brasiliensis]|nr:hypothetical protein GX48_02588 [Paracoccidioides brasiliensis]